MAYTDLLASRNGDFEGTSFWQFVTGSGYASGAYEGAQCASLQASRTVVLGTPVLVTGDMRHPCGWTWRTDLDYEVTFRAYVLFKAGSPLPLSIYFREPDGTTTLLASFTQADAPGPEYALLTVPAFTPPNTAGALQWLCPAPPTNGSQVFWQIDLVTARIAESVPGPVQVAGTLTDPRHDRDGHGRAYVDTIGGMLVAEEDARVDFLNRVRPLSDVDRLGRDEQQGYEVRPEEEPPPP